MISEPWLYTQHKAILIISCFVRMPRTKILFTRPFWCSFLDWYNLIRTNIKPNQNLKKKHFRQKKPFRIINSFNNYVPHQILEKQKKPFLIIQVFNSLTPHHFRWSTPVMMVKLLWRLSIYFVSDSSHILTFTVLLLQVYRIRSTSRGPTSSRTLVEEFAPEPSFVNKLVNHILIIFCSDFQLLYL